MMIRTVIGQVVEPLGLVRQRRLVEPPLERTGPFHFAKPEPFWRDEHFALRPLDVRSVQPTYVPVNLEHDDHRAIGHVVHLELDHQGGLWAVAECVADDEELAEKRCSPRWRSDPDGRHGVVEHVALVVRPGQGFVPPVVWFDGGLADRRHWRLPLRLEGIVERAAAAAPRRGQGAALVVHDVDQARRDRHDAALELERGTILASLARLDRSRRPGPVLDDADDAPPPGCRGELETRPAKIIAVR